MILTYKNQRFEIQESEYGYVSPYSFFMIDNYPLNLSDTKVICDFGAGTGVLGIVATAHVTNRIVSIENNIDCFKLLKRNYQANHINSATCRFLQYSEDCDDCFDTILCNPASLPNLAEVNSFCDGGELGLDMIFTVLRFAKDHLKMRGKLYVIITSILPRSLIKAELRALEMQYRVVSRRQIEFRSHYTGIDRWVDSFRTWYNEMYYIDIDGILYEELFLLEITKVR